MKYFSLYLCRYFIFLLETSSLKQYFWHFESPSLVFSITRFKVGRYLIRYLYNLINIHYTYNMSKVLIIKERLIRVAMPKGVEIGALGWPAVSVRPQGWVSTILMLMSSAVKECFFVFSKISTFLTRFKIK